MTLNCIWGWSLSFEFCVVVHSLYISILSFETYNVFYVVLPVNRWPFLILCLCYFFTRLLKNKLKSTYLMGRSASINGLSQRISTLKFGHIPCIKNYHYIYIYIYIYTRRKNLTQELVIGSIVYGCNFSKEINHNDESFSVQEYCQHDFLYWPLHPEHLLFWKVNELSFRLRLLFPNRSLAHL